MSHLMQGANPYTVQVPQRISGAPDLGPLIAIAVALLIVRFVLWGHFSIRTVAVGVVAGLLWSVAADRMGAAFPALVGLAVAWLLSRIQEARTQLG